MREARVLTTLQKTRSTWTGLHRSPMSCAARASLVKPYVESIGVRLPTSLLCVSVDAGEEQKYTYSLRRCSWIVGVSMSAGSTTCTSAASDESSSTRVAGAVSGAAHCGEELLHPLLPGTGP